MGRKRDLRVRNGSTFADVTGTLSGRLGWGWRIPKMSRISTFRAALVALVPLFALALAGLALAQSPTPAASPSASPSPAPSATPAPPPAETKSPPDTPSAAQTPAPPPATPVQTADPFGE